MDIIKHFMKKRTLEVTHPFFFHLFTPVAAYRLRVYKNNKNEKSAEPQTVGLLLEQSVCNPLGVC